MIVSDRQPPRNLGAVARPAIPNQRSFDALYSIFLLTVSLWALLLRPPARGRSRIGGGGRSRARSPAMANRTDRQREHRLAGGAGGSGLGADQQIRRGLSRPPLLRRVQV